jgi:hypothetical protein
LWMLSPFRTMAVCWLARQCSMISYLAAGAFFSNFWCWLNFRAVVFLVRVDWMCVGQRVVEDGGRHLGGVKFNCVCVDRHTVYVCVWGLARYIKLTAAEIGAAASRFILPATVLTSGCYDGYLPLFYSLMSTSFSISFLPSTWDNNLAVNVPGISVTPPSCRGSYWNVFNMVTSLMMLACPLDCYFFFFFFFPVSFSLTNVHVLVGSSSFYDWTISTGKVSSLSGGAGVCGSVRLWPTVWDSCVVPKSQKTEKKLTKQKSCPWSAQLDPSAWFSYRPFLLLLLFCFIFLSRKGATGNRMGTTTATTRRPFFFFFQNLYTTGPAELPGR